MIRAVALALLLIATSAHAQDTGSFTNRSGTGPALAGDPLKLSELHSAFGAKSSWPLTSDQAGNPALAYPGSAPVNASGNPGISPTYFGSSTFNVPGLIRSPSGHYNLTGYTRGWADGTCILSVNANPAAAGVANGCGQGGFWDPWYRTVYPGQDSDAVSFGIGGIVPVAKDAPVSSFGSTSVVNYASAVQTVGAITLSPPLSTGQVAAINAAKGPMRVQVNNGYFGYTIPSGMTFGGLPVAAASADGTQVLVDNFTRSVIPGNGTPPGTAGGTAALPTLPYVARPGNGGGTGNGIYPNQVGLTNGSSPLSSYTVTIDGNYLAEVMYLNVGIGPNDVINNARISEEGIGNNKTGTSTWNDLEPLGDLLDGKPFGIQFHLASCVADSGSGNGTCGAYAYVGSGIKRGIVFNNPSISADEGGTEGVLDIASTFGWKSVKSTGYVLWVDPGNTGNPSLVIDAQGDINDANRIFVGSGGAGVTIAPNGSVTASGSVKSAGWSILAPSGQQTGYADGQTGNLVIDGGLAPGNFSVAGEPGCNSSYLGLQVYLTNARKPGEGSGAGSGVLAVCSPPSLGVSPQWLSVFDHMPAQG